MFKAQDQAPLNLRHLVMNLVFRLIQEKSLAGYVWSSGRVCALGYSVRPAQQRMWQQNSEVRGSHGAVATLYGWEGNRVEDNFKMKVETEWKIISGRNFQFARSSRVYHTWSSTSRQVSWPVLVSLTAYTSLCCSLNLLRIKGTRDSTAQGASYVCAVEYMFGRDATILDPEKDEH